MATRLNVLLLENEPQQAQRVVRELSRAGFDPSWTCVETEAEYLAGLHSGLDLIIANHQLPRFTGLEALRLLQECGLDIPFILASGAAEEDVAAIALQEGADDYLFKDCLARLGPAVKAALERRRQREERRRAEQKAAQLAAVVESSEDAIVSATPSGVILSWNPGAERLFGYAAAEVVGKSASLVIPHDRADELPGNLERVRRGERIPAFETVRQRKDGARIDLSMAISPIRDAAGGTAGVSVIYRDITERKKSETTLRQWKDRYEAAAQATGNLLYDWDAAADDAIYGGNIVAMLGYTAEEMGGGLVKWLAILHPEDRAAFEEEMERVKRTGGAFRLDYRVRRKDGAYIHARDDGQVVLDQAGTVVRIVGFVTDATERRALEDQYRQAQKMDAVGRLAGGVAHDFNNLLTVINGSSQLLLDGLPADDPSRDLLRDILSAGDRAAILTRQLLAFSRKAIVAPKVLDLKAVVADMERLLRRVIGEDVELATAADPGPGAVRADPGQIEQVLMNLAVNARDAMPRGGQLTIETRNVDLDEAYARSHPAARPGPHVLLSVSDTGVGMDAATLGRIWEPFFTTKGERGAGLGLATVYGMVRQSGGHVTVESRPGAGAVFRIYLPRVEERPSGGKSHPGRKVMPRGVETILLVEDEDGVRAVTRHVLGACGYTVLEAEDGVKALLLAEEYEGRIDLLATDVVLPHVGGAELAVRIGSVQPDMKVLFLSGYTEDAVLRHGIRDAEVDFLQKPYTPAILACKVREVLDRR